jgi:hypothetical protein
MTMTAMMMMMMMMMKTTMMMNHHLRNLSLHQLLLENKYAGTIVSSKLII